MSPPRYVGAGHLDVLIEQEIAAANLASLLAREKARGTGNPAPPPTEFIEPRSTSVPNGTEDDHGSKPRLTAVPKPAVTKSAPSVPKTRTRLPAVPPGYVLMNPREADIVRRMIESHPDTKEMFE